VNLPRGFLGTDADLLIDVVIVALPVVLVVMGFAIRKAKQGDWGTHKAIQITLTAVLTVVVTLLEIDVRTKAGGILEMAKDSQFSGTGVLIWTLRIHLVFATTTAIIWLGLIGMSLKRFDAPPRPNAFSAMHRLWGRIGAIDMALTAGTGLLFYVLCFVMTGQ
jgi:hypothetical protein